MSTYPAFPVAIIVMAGLTAAYGQDAATAGNGTERAAPSSTAAEAASSAAPDESTTVEALPLKRGFYVASDTPCGQASNATLLLVRKDGINGSRDTCTFKKIEKIDATRYRAVSECSSGGAAWGREEEIETETVVYTVPDDSSFTSKSESGWEHSARYCAQSSLPESWRDNDISDLVQ